jgi:hypothetical protein
MTIESDDEAPAISVLTVVRGANPRPESGWPWHLTPYEVEYVRSFNVRPMRDDSWDDSGKTGEHLDQEAEGVPRAQRGSGSKLLARRPASRRRTSIWAIVTVLLVLLAAYLGALSLNNISSSNRLDHDTTKVNSQ